MFDRVDFIFIDLSHTQEQKLECEVFFLPAAGTRAFHSENQSCSIQQTVKL